MWSVSVLVSSRVSLDGWLANRERVKEDLAAAAVVCTVW